MNENKLDYYMNLKYEVVVEPLMMVMLFLYLNSLAALRRLTMHQKLFQ